ncbi:MAG: hypothetical protein AAGD05_18245, partial [Bacteroidota bacterium]
SFAKLDTKSWEGVLPEGITFDADGKMIAITSYDFLDLTQRKGAVAFWEIVINNAGHQLRDTGFKLSVTRGSHYVRIVK